MKRSPDNNCVRFKDLLFKIKTLIQFSIPVSQPEQNKNSQKFQVFQR
jgi:hypothetical protein